MDNNIFVELTNCDEKTLKKISQYCDNYFREKTTREQDEKYVKNSKYVGKCYVLNTKNGKRFYKVISVKSNNQFRISCLVFDENPSAKFHPLFQKAIPHHDNEGTIHFEGIYVEDIMIKKTFMCVAIEDMTEISEGEWRYALQRYINQLIDFDWSRV